ncbi:putative glycolipid-binding domain-containing protein [Nocardia mangyaensis]|uniref:putative glycolipid-binding domain-containing protein n=1 Tax=Nocardia mangyaensis TaxID=2213200 RepID=UPI002675BF48|nr:putative glycolipid-binding domain-containing protein [Nocardia mangyaensis]MDO3647330.1 putative glycolipid-binding domain-containing protein [Nocardia mangyaensis]
MGNVAHHEPATVREEHTVSFTALPPSAAWRHREGRTGFEVAYFHRDERGVVVEGCATAAEDGVLWAIDYRLRLDGSWHTRSARIIGRYREGRRTLNVQSDGLGRWQIDGNPVPELDGCLDIDLEASAFTNALPVRRLDLTVGDAADAPAVYIRAGDLTANRLPQHYRRVVDGAGQRYDYTAPTFDFTATLEYDEHGLVVDYPGLAERTA